jgi:PDZ domain-containing protein
MIRPTCAISTVGLTWIAFCLAGLVAACPVTVSEAAQGTAPGQPGSVSEASAEVGLPTPARFAIVLHATTKVGMLYARGDVVSHLQDPTHYLTIERVEEGALFVRMGRRGQPRTLRAGAPLPGFPDVIFAGTVWLDELRYQYRVVGHRVYQEPTLVSLEGSRAILEAEVLRPTVPTPAPQSPPPTRAILDANLLSQVQVREVGPGLYEVPVEDARAVLDNAGRVLADLAPIVLPFFSVQKGMQYRIKSAAGDGILGGQGFTVNIPKLAERAGIEVGDTILSVNGQSVDGLPSLFRIFRTIRRDPDLRTVEMALERQGKRLTKTYRLR